MLPRIEFDQLTFGTPEYLWLLVVPELLACVWGWRFVRRRADARRVAARRLLPVRQRLAFLGDSPFWLVLIAAVACVIFALARPQGPATILRDAGIDLVILQDASASMRVTDVPGNRWQRSVRFLRVLGNSLSWRHDRIAMAVFARIAAPQVRLTTDPNTFFFFADHLYDEPPFRLADESTWDTNLERGIHWGLRLIERDEELHGRSPNAKLFVMVSDGEAWSGEVETSLERAVDARVPLYVVGVGTLAGGRMPPFIGPDGKEERDPETPLVSRLDRPALQKIAATGGGQYFELDRDGDRNIANAIIDAGKRMAPSLGVTVEAEPLYWYFLALGSVLGGAALIFLRERTDIWMLLAGTVAVGIGLAPLLF